MYWVAFVVWKMADGKYQAFGGKCMIEDGALPMYSVSWLLKDVAFV